MPVFNENSVFSSGAFICYMFLVLIERLQKLNSTSLFDSVRHHFETKLAITVKLLARFGVNPENANSSLSCTRNSSLKLGVQ